MKAEKMTGRALQDKECGVSSCVQPTHDVWDPQLTPLQKKMFK